MPERLRPKLSQHFIGTLLTGTPEENLLFIKSHVKEYKYIITVGDVVTLTITSGDLQPKLSIIDYRCLRKEHPLSNIVKSRFRKVIRTCNPPGRITLDAWNSIKEALRGDEPTLIEVHGEEDLLAIPAVLEADYGSLVIYGLPSKGMVMILVTDYTKNIMRGILNEFIFVDEE